MTLDAHTHFELVKSNSNFVFYQININQSEFTVPVYLPRWTDVPWKAPGRGTGTRFGQGQIFLYEVSQRVSI